MLVRLLRSRDLTDVPISTEQRKGFLSGDNKKGVQWNTLASKRRCRLDDNEFVGKFSTLEILQNLCDRGYTAVLLNGYHTGVEHLFADNGAVSTISRDSELFGRYRHATRRLAETIDRRRLLPDSGPSPGSSAESVSAPGSSGKSDGCTSLNRLGPQALIRFLAEKGKFTVMLLNECDGAPAHIYADDRECIAFTSVDDVLGKYESEIHAMWQWVLAIWT